VLSNLMIHRTTADACTEMMSDGRPLQTVLEGDVAPSHWQKPTYDDDQIGLQGPASRRIQEPIRRNGGYPSAIRVRRPALDGFSRLADGRLEARLELERPHGLLGLVWRLIIGEPIHNRRESHERLGVLKALPVFSSDALSSVAYGPQAVLTVLMLGGAAALGWSLPISALIIVMLGCVAFSYRQTIYAYPSGGGSYIVAHENLGRLPGLAAAGALSVGYVLTVAVSISSAVDQFISAVPSLAGLRVLLGVLCVTFVTLANLRGVRDSGSIFAAPTYLFLVAMAATIGMAFYRYACGDLNLAPMGSPAPVVESVSLVLLLRAFAVGSAVMTGTEAISNGVPAFRAPESRNAAHTLVLMASLLGTMFAGLAVLIYLSGVQPNETDTIISQFSRAAFGDSVGYYLVQASTSLILVLGANTAFADFPRLASLLAKDNYAPHQLAFRGERLAFSNGIVLLGILGAGLIALFGGDTGALIPLYALGVFMAFTMSQSGMVRHWFRLRGPRWRSKAVVNGLGATLTGTVAVVAAITNLSDPHYPLFPGFGLGWGTWLAVIIIPAAMWVFVQVHRHYAQVARSTRPLVEPRPFRSVLVVPVARIDAPTLKALHFARSLSADVSAVYVRTDHAASTGIERDWKTWGGDTPLTVIDSPYRSLTGPLLQYLSEVRKLEHADIVMVVVPEFVPDHWWEHLLHNQSAGLLKLALLFRSGFVVTSVPMHARDARLD
jgi:amino acid transporter